MQEGIKMISFLAEFLVPQIYRFVLNKRISFDESMAYGSKNALVAILTTL